MRTRSNGHKLEHGKFHLNRRKLFYCDGGWALECLTQRGCGLFILGDFLYPAGHSPALADPVLSQGTGLDGFPRCLPTSPVLQLCKSVLKQNWLHSQSQPHTPILGNTTLPMSRHSGQHAGTKTCVWRGFLEVKEDNEIWIWVLTTSPVILSPRNYVLVWGVPLYPSGADCDYDLLSHHPVSPCEYLATVFLTWYRKAPALDLPTISPPWREPLSSLGEDCPFFSVLPWFLFPGVLESCM